MNRVKTEIEAVCGLLFVRLAEPAIYRLKVEECHER